MPPGDHIQPFLERFPWLLSDHCEIALNQNPVDTFLRDCVANPFLVMIGAGQDAVHPSEIHPFHSQALCQMHRRSFGALYAAYAA